MPASASTQAHPAWGPNFGGWRGDHHHTLRPAYLGTKPQGDTPKGLVHKTQSQPHQCSTHIGRYAMELLLGDFSAGVLLTFEHPYTPCRGPNTRPPSRR